MKGERRSGRARARASRKPVQFGDRSSTVRTLLELKA